MDTSRTTRRAFLGGAAGLAALGLAGCSRPEDGGQTQEELPLVYAQALAPDGLDPSLTPSLETRRIAAQVLEPLVRANPDTGTAMAHLATDWQVSDDGLTYTFTLRQGVRFHDGTVLDAEAVRQNVLRWKQAAEEEHHPATAFQTVFRHGPARGTGASASIFGDVRARDADTLVLRLRSKHTPLLRALTQPAFGIGSPAAFADAQAYARRPVGTGPFAVDAVQDDGTVRLKPHEDYWGDAAHLTSLEFRALEGASARYYGLLSGQVDAIDQVGTSDFVSLARRGYQIQQRDSYDLACVCINRAVTVFDDPQVRQAVAHAINRSDLVRQFYPQGTEVANDFTPKLFDVAGSKSSSRYRYDLGLAQDLLKASGYQDETLRFYYPTDVSLPWLPQPEAVYAQISAGLTRAGFVIQPVPIRWEDDYPARASRPDADRALALTGGIGSFRDPDDFIAPLFSARNDQLNLEDADLVSEVRKAAQAPDGEERKSLYRKINDHIAQDLAAVPLAFPISAVALASRVTYYPLAATGVANFADVTVDSA